MFQEITKKELIDWETYAMEHECSLKGLLNQLLLIPYSSMYPEERAMSYYKIIAPWYQTMPFGVGDCDQLIKFCDFLQGMKSTLPTEGEVNDSSVQIYHNGRSRSIKEWKFFYHDEWYILETILWEDTPKKIEKTIEIVNELITVILQKKARILYTGAY